MRLLCWARPGGVGGDGGHGATAVKVVPGWEVLGRGGGGGRAEGSPVCLYVQTPRFREV